MSDYAFVHGGKAFTPNQTAVGVAQVAERNAAIERAELKEWQAKPDRMLAYFKFPAEDLPLFGRPRVYREDFRPILHTFVENGYDKIAIVSTWLGTKLGVIVSARVYRHNFGSRMVSIRVQGTNGAEYYGRASWDHGNCINLRRVK